MPNYKRDVNISFGDKGTYIDLDKATLLHVFTSSLYKVSLYQCSQKCNEHSMKENVYCIYKHPQRGTFKIINKRIWIYTSNRGY